MIRKLWTLGKECFKQIQYNFCLRNNVICHLCEQRLKDNHGNDAINQHEYIGPVINNNKKIIMFKNNSDSNYAALIVNSNETMELSANTEHIFDYLIIEPNGTLKIKQEDIDKKPSSLILTINNDLILEHGAMINVSASGCFEDTDNDLNIGRGGDGTQFGGGGGYGRNGQEGRPLSLRSKGMKGDKISGTGGIQYGDTALNDVYYGSSGGNGGHQDAKGGRGGGILLLNVKKSIFIGKKAKVKSDGGVGKYKKDKFDIKHVGGCGSGGSIKIYCNQLFIHQQCGVSTASGFVPCGDLPKCPAIAGDGRMCIFIEDDVNRENYLNCWNKICFNPKAYITNSSFESKYMDLLITGYIRQFNIHHIMIPRDLLTFIKRTYKGNDTDIILLNINRWLEVELGF